MEINTVKELANAVRQGNYTLLGGYPIYFVCADGGVLSPKAVKDNYKLIARAVKEKGVYNRSWQVVGFDINWEDPNLYCCDTNERIPSAYAEESA